MRQWLATAVLVFLPACFAPPGPMERLSYTAYDLNTATRFGRMDVAVSHVAATAQSDFMDRHANWGSDIRIVDVELSGMRLVTPETAEVRLAVSWHRIDETTVRVSAVAQRWTMGERDWQLSEEIRTGGSPGLFLASRVREEDDRERLPNPNMGQL